MHSCFKAHIILSLNSSHTCTVTGFHLWLEASLISVIWKQSANHKIKKQGLSFKRKQRLVHLYTTAPKPWKRQRTWLTLRWCKQSSRGWSSWSSVGYSRNRPLGHTVSIVSWTPGSSDTHSSVWQLPVHLHTRTHTKRHPYSALEQSIQ